MVIFPNPNSQFQSALESLRVVEELKAWGVRLHLLKALYGSYFARTSGLNRLI